MTEIAETRRFSVHARHVDSHHARILEEASFEAAAIAYIEHFHPPVGDESDIIVIVREVTTGHQACFSVDLETGQTAPCG